MTAAAYPGSFNPPTVAHLEIAAAARDALDVARVDLVVSTVALAKEHVDRPRFDHRIGVLREVASARDWLEVVVTEARLLADIAAGYHGLVLGADKWVQLHDPEFYGDSAEARDAALARLPRLAVAPRHDHPLPRHDPRAVILEVDLHHVSSTAARRGAAHLMLPEARAFDEATGAWTDPERYDRDHRP